MSTILITGASSGLGLAFLKHYTSTRPAPKILAVDITPLPSSVLDLSNVDFHNIDITSEASLVQLATKLEHEKTKLDLLIHSAGVRGLVPAIIHDLRETGGDIAPAETYEVMTKETMLRTFEINTWGTFNLIKQLLPCIIPSGSESIPKVVILSSRMGSVSSNVAGGGYAYRASKAALNAVVKSFAIDVPNVAFLMLHPGRVETALVEWKEEGAISVEESIADCLKVIEKSGKENSGTLVDRFGEMITW
jgi:NAD(P)-dependent dehydrogenase (short-subunit alcohol dehydrogenase family)